MLTASQTTPPAASSHLVQYEPVEVGHVALVGQKPFVIVFKMFFEGHGVVRDLHHCAQVVRQYLKNHNMTIRWQILTFLLNEHILYETKSYRQYRSCSFQSLPPKQPSAVQALLVKRYRWTFTPQTKGTFYWFVQLSAGTTTSPQVPSEGVVA